MHFIILFWFLSLSPNIDNSSESGSESTSSSSEESNNGSTKNAETPTTTETNNKWSLHSFIKADVQTKPIQPIVPLDNNSQQNQGQPLIATNIKNEPLSTIDEDLLFPATQNQMTKDIFHPPQPLQQTTKLLNNFDMDHIKQEPIGKQKKNVFTYLCNFGVLCVSKKKN